MFPLVFPTKIFICLCKRSLYYLLSVLIYHFSAERVLISFYKADPSEIKEFVETTITIEKETAGLGLGIVGGSDTYLVRK